MPFSLIISSYRRRKILDAMMNKDKQKRDDGEKILNNYKKQIAERENPKTNKNNQNTGGGKTTLNKS